MRITGGSLRGRPVEAPEGMGTRPTGDRARVALFNILQGRLGGAAVLDGSAGSGALSFEALSRGAAEAVLFERDAGAAARIAGNAGRLGLSERVRLYRADFLTGVRLLEGRQFDLVFLDPPYASGLLEGALAAVDSLGLLRPGGVVVAEHSSAAAPPPTVGALGAADSRRYGAEGFTFYKRQG